MIDHPNEETSLTNFDFSPDNLITPSNPLDEQSANVEVIKKLFDEVVVDVPILASGDRYEEINSIASAVVQLYRPIESRKESIKKGLDGFKEALGLHTDSAMPGCFKALRDSVDSNVHLELVFAGEETIKMKINELPTTSNETKPIPNEAKKAVLLFNSCLTHCQKFQGEKELKIADIQFRLEELQLMPLTKEGQILFKQVNKIPEYIEELSNDIACLQKEIHKASSLLRPN